MGVGRGGGDPQGSSELVEHRYLRQQRQRKGMGLGQTDPGCVTPGNDDR